MLYEWVASHERAETMSALQVGMWLGTENRIARLQERAYGWLAVDSTGAQYRQDDNPRGLPATDEPQADASARPYVPWPERAQ